MHRNKISSLMLVDTPRSSFVFQLTLRGTEDSCGRSRTLCGSVRSIIPALSLLVVVVVVDCRDEGLRWNLLEGYVSVLRNARVVEANSQRTRDNGERCSWESESVVAQCRERRCGCVVAGPRARGCGHG